MRERGHWDLLVIGELNVDIIAAGLERLPKLGEEILASNLELRMGSSSAICAAAASKLGLRVGFVGKVGDDLFGHFVVERLQELGVDTKPIIVDPSIRTGATISISTSEDRGLVTYLGSISALTLQDIDPSLFNQTRHVHSSSFFLQLKLLPDYPDLFAAAKEYGCTTSLDTGYDPMKRWDSTLWDTLHQTDVFLPNEVEAPAIAGRGDLGAALETLAEVVPTVVVKLGSEGALAYQEEKKVQIPAFPVEVVETTGAGDTFNAGFLTAWLRGLTLEESLILGVAAGSLSVTKIGGSEGAPWLKEVGDFLLEQGHPLGKRLAQGLEP
ncbi:MAG: carbohydrate kinase family protein [Chloroflexota bacterium]|nr:carbohydrate kinase family protein [Chloroflexota bacterium]